MNKNIITIIPARGGSKGIPGKNIKLFNGIPLIIYSIEYAQSIIPNSHIFVSTDCSEIKKIVKNSHVNIIDRPENISGDNALTESAISHTLKNIGFTTKNIILLQPTSPLRPKNSLSKIIEHFEKNKFDSLLTISPSHRFFWEINNDLAHPKYDYLNRPRRQDMTASDIKYIENGSVYMFTNDIYHKNKNRLGGKIGYYIFPEEYSFEIDSMNDWINLEQIVKQITIKK